jgi:hypothetical protein
MSEFAKKGPSRAARHAQAKRLALWAGVGIGLALWGLAVAWLMNGGAL